MRCRPFVRKAFDQSGIAFFHKNLIILITPYNLRGRIRHTYQIKEALLILSNITKKNQATFVSSGS